MRSGESSAQWRMDRASASTSPGGKTSAVVPGTANSRCPAHVGSDQGAPARHRLAGRQAPPLLMARGDEQRRVVVELPQPRLRGVSHVAHPRGHPAGARHHAEHGHLEVPRPSRPPQRLHRVPRALVGSPVTKQRNGIGRPLLEGPVDPERGKIEPVRDIGGPSPRATRRAPQASGPWRSCGAAASTWPRPCPDHPPRFRDAGGGRPSCPLRGDRRQPTRPSTTPWRSRHRRRAPPLRPAAGPTLPNCGTKREPGCSRVPAGDAAQGMTGAAFPPFAGRCRPCWENRVDDRDLVAAIREPVRVFIDDLDAADGRVDFREDEEGDSHARTTSERSRSRMDSRRRTSAANSRIIVVLDPRPAPRAVRAPSSAPTSGRFRRPARF